MNKIIFQLLFIVFFLLFLLAIVHIFDSKEGYDTHVGLAPSLAPTSAAPAPVPLTTYDPSNYNVQYHATAEDIQSQLDIDMSSNLVSVRDASGNIVQKPVSQTASDTTYYTSGTLKYNPANYVPNYEDTIYFSKLTGLGYQAPVVDTNAQLSGFCKYDRYFPDKIEEKCGKLDSTTCASTTCCVLMGGKCFAGNLKGPYYKAHYSDLDLRNKDKYYYMGRCYGNCVDDQSNYYDYGVTQQSYKQSMPGFAEDNPAYLPNMSDYLGTIAPNSFNTAVQNPNAVISKMQCRIDTLGNLVDSTGVIVANGVTLDSQGNFVDSKGQIVGCPSAGSAPAPASGFAAATAPSTTIAGSPIAASAPAPAVIFAAPVDSSSTNIPPPIMAPPTTSDSTIAGTPVTSTTTPISTPSPTYGSPV